MSRPVMTHSYPRSEEDEKKTKNVWLKGHTGKYIYILTPLFTTLIRHAIDLGSMTILWSQPISALQMLSPDGKWRWVKHIPNALVSFLTFQGR